MLTWSKAGIFKPTTYSTTKHPLPTIVDFVPTTYLQASNYENWRQAMQEEFNDL